MRIFVAHALADKSIIEEKIITPLTNAGYDIRLCDVDDREQLEQAIINSDVIIEIITPSFFESDMDAWLAETTGNLSKSIISVQLLETDDRLLITRNMNIIDFTSPDDSGLQTLISHIESIKADSERQVKLATGEISIGALMSGEASLSPETEKSDNTENTHQKRHALRDWQLAIVITIVLFIVAGATAGLYFGERYFRVQSLYDRANSSDDISEQLTYYSEIISLDRNQASAYYERGTLYMLREEYQNADTDFAWVMSIEPNHDGIHLARGLAYLNSDDVFYHESAINYFTEALERETNLAEVYLGRGQAYDKLGQYQNAIADFTHVIRLNPDSYEAYALRGRSYGSLEDYHMALHSYEVAFNLNPDNADVYYYRAVTYSMMGDYELANADFDRALALEPDAKRYNEEGDSYFQLGDYETAIKSYTEAIELDPQYALAYSNRGEAYYELGNYESAIADFTQSIELSPIHWNPTFHRGLAYFDTGDYESAIDDMSEAIRINPDNKEAHLYRGLAYYETEDYDEAIIDLTEALEFETSARVYTYRGLSYLEQSVHRTAQNDFTEAIELDPTYRQAYIGRAEALYERNLLQQALADYSEALILEETSETYFQRGRIYVEMDEASAGLKDFTEASRLAPEDIELLEAIADIYRDNDNTGLTLQYYTLAIRIEPTIDRYENRGLLYYELENYSQALEDFTEVLLLEPDNADILFRRGYAYDYQDEYQLAVDDYTRVLELQPSSAAYNNRGWAYYSLGEFELAIEDYEAGIVLDSTYPNLYWGLGSTYLDFGDADLALVNYCLYLRYVDDPNTWIENFVEEAGGCK